MVCVLVWYLLRRRVSWCLGLSFSCLGLWRLFCFLGSCVACYLSASIFSLFDPILRREFGSSRVPAGGAPSQTSRSTVSQEGGRVSRAPQREAREKAGIAPEEHKLRREKTRRAHTMGKTSVGKYNFFSACVPASPFFPSQTN